MPKTGTPAAGSLREVGTPGPGKAPLRIEGFTACGCGCGRPARVEFRLLGHTVMYDDPTAIDAAVDVLVELRTALWGPRPKGGG